MEATAFMPDGAEPEVEPLDAREPGLELARGGYDAATLLSAVAE
jgi:hypothetical protein